MNVLVASKLSDKKLRSKLLPIVSLDYVKEIYLVRLFPISMDKVTCYCPPKWLRGYARTCELIRFVTLFYLCCTKPINLICGIYLLWSGVFAGVLGRIFSLPVVQFIIGDDLHYVLKRNYYLYFLKHAKAVIVRGPEAKKLLIDREIPSDRIKFPQNIFNFEEYKPIPLNEPREIDVLYVGNLEACKRLDILVHSVYKVVFEYQLTSLRVAIVGTGSKLKSLQRMVKKKNLQDNIIFHGWQKDIKHFMRNSRMLILTSEFEGLPMVMLEAMSMGLPCIMPNKGDIPTIACHRQNALLVSVGDISGFAECIFELMRNESLYCDLAKKSLDIRESKKTQYSLNYIIQEWDLIFKQILENQTIQFKKDCLNVK